MLRNDYGEIAAKEVIEALSAMMHEPIIGYGEDHYSESAKKRIAGFFGVPGADVHFLAGGTVTNMTVISYFLRPYEAVIACDTGHINVHETGAVEASGHKVIACPNHDGKLTAEDIDAAVKKHSDEHMVLPKMVYISEATETGTVYTAEELLAIREACDRNGLLLFLDGARLGAALTCGVGDLTPELIGRVSDVFYAGGTKNGLLFGEAVVIKDPSIAPDFRYHIKNRGAMLAKGFITGAQFDVLFTDSLYLKLAQNSIDKANVIKKGLTALGVEFVGNSPTNQQFIRLDAEKAQMIMDRFGCEKWSEDEKGTVVRIVTSFSTTDEECCELLDFVKNNF